MIKDRSFKNIKTGEIISAYKYGKEDFDEEWQDLKNFGAIPPTSSDYDSPNMCYESYVEYGVNILLGNKDYVEC